VHGGQNGNRWGTQVAAPGSELWHRCSSFHYDQYLKLGWVEPNPNRVVLEYEAWSSGDVAFHAAFDVHNRLIGTLRTVFGPLHDQPLATVCRDLAPSDQHDRCVEFASLVVDPSVKSLGAAEALYASGFAWTVTHQAEHILALVDSWLFEIFRDTYSIPFEPLGEPVPYLGTTPLPLAVSVEDLARSVSAGNPRFWSVLTSDVNPDAFSRVVASGQASTL
jgi:hypothetical protein